MHTRVGMHGCARRCTCICAGAYSYLQASACVHVSMGAPVFVCVHVSMCSSHPLHPTSPLHACHVPGMASGHCVHSPSSFGR